MKAHCAVAALVLLVIAAHTRVTVLPGWQVPVLPLVLVTAVVTMSGVLCWALRPARRRPRYHRPAAAGGAPWIP